MECREVRGARGKRHFWSGMFSLNFPLELSHGENRGRSPSTALCWAAECEVQNEAKQLGRRCAKAIADYSDAVRIDPKDDSGYNDRAWTWATCPDDKFRDGAKAVESATKACELSEWKNANDIGTLAAAYAEIGKFDDAIKWGQKAIDLQVADKENESKESLEIDRKQLEQFKLSKPYRTEPIGK
jgi:tetratricopeptide (TPR) repeat protein